MVRIGYALIVTSIHDAPGIPEKDENRSKSTKVIYQFPLAQLSNHNRANNVAGHVCVAIDS